MLHRVFVPIANEDEVIQSDRNIQAQVYKTALTGLRDEVKLQTEKINKEYGKIKKADIQEQLYYAACPMQGDEKTLKKCSKIASKNAKEVFDRIKEEAGQMRNAIKELRAQIKTLLLEKKEKYAKLKEMDIETYSKMSLYRELKKKCNKRVSSEKEMAEYMKNSQQFQEFKEKIEYYNDKIKSANDKLKIYMTAYRAKIKELQFILKTGGPNGDFTEDEKRVIKMTIKSHQQKHKTKFKTLKKNVRDEVSGYKSSMKVVNDNKKVLLQDLKKNIKSELTRYKRQKTSLKRIEKNMLKDLKDNGHNIVSFGEKAREILNEYKQKTADEFSAAAAKSAEKPKRCPKGTKRNRKTGECEEVK